MQSILLVHFRLTAKKNNSNDDDIMKPSSRTTANNTSKNNNNNNNTTTNNKNNNAKDVTITTINDHNKVSKYVNALPFSYPPSSSNFQL